MPDPNSSLRAELAAFDASDLALLRKATILALSGMCDRHIDTLVKQGKFPAPVKLSRKVVRWPAGALRKWLAEQAAAAAA
jgi:predicted DNA-binding transcriptional regulator AlpA